MNFQIGFIIVLLSILGSVSFTLLEEIELDNQEQFQQDELVTENSDSEEELLPIETKPLVANRTGLVSCLLDKPDIKSTVEIVNATRLSQFLQYEQNVTHKGVPGTCTAAFFYSPSCPFSCLAAPHFNAMQRFFPDIRMVALDVMRFRDFNTKYGIVGTPTLMLFHSGRPAAKFNETKDYRLEAFANFITRHTGIRPSNPLVMTLADFNGPISSIPVKETNYYLMLSWMVIAARILYSFYYSTWGKNLMDATINAWREAEAQHHHID